MASGLYQPVRSWTLAGLVLAFVDLLVAYILLCVSAVVFFPCKFLIFVENSLPCPCTGVFGFQSSDFCWHSLLIDRPIRNIGCVMELVKSRFPFGLVCSRYQNPGLVVSSGCGDAKGKRIVNQKNRFGLRQRRRAVLGDGKCSNGLNSCVSNSICASDSVCCGIVQSLDLRGLSEFAISDTRHAENSIDSSVSTGQYLEESGFDEKGKAVELGSSSDKFACSNEEGLGCAANEANKCRLLEKALQEEKVARAALYLELDKERAAAATAADEAMAMILRLQEDKAAIEMEARQYQRMIEEKFAYDEDEMDILKEILVRRERENHFLERKLEAYREIDVSSSEELDEGDFVEADAFDRNGKEPENDEDHQCKIKNGDDCSSHTDEESTVYDIHVIDDKSIIWKGNVGEKKKTFGLNELRFWGLQLRGGRLKTDCDVERLKERPRTVQEKEKPSFSTEEGERVNAHLKLIEEIAKHLPRVSESDRFNMEGSFATFIF